MTVSPSHSPSSTPWDKWTVPGICILLAAIIWVVFGQTLCHEFVNLDDDRYVSENPVVQKGLTLEGFRWALTYGNIGHWHPLTWLSHMLDCQLYGLHAGGHHLTNVLLHAATTVLLFLVLRRMMRLRSEASSPQVGLRSNKSIGATTPQVGLGAAKRVGAEAAQGGVPWSSAFVAAVFAIHPLRAESVAWVAERKDILSAFFFMLTLAAYVRYVRRPPSMIRYGAVVLFFALGLLSKNMLVTMPFVLLLLDYWPLNRLSSFSLRVLLRLVAEKIPLFVLSVGSCVATALVSEKMTAAHKLPFGLRMENAVVSYVIYLWQVIHPLGLACVYPNPTNYLPVWQVAGAVGLLLGISGAAWVFRRTHPWLMFGWLWYLGMMVPVIGLVQISHYAHADRYTYLPQIGLYLAMVWAIKDWTVSWRYRRQGLGVAAVIVIAALMTCAWKQTSYWRNSESLWTHTLACTSENYVAHSNLGITLTLQGRLDEAMEHFQKALDICPGYPECHNNLGNVLVKRGQVDDAMAHYQKAIELNPNHAEFYINLGHLLATQGRTTEAIAQFRRAIDLNPDFAEAHCNLGMAFGILGQLDEAVGQYRKAIKIKPDYANAHGNLANVLAAQGKLDEAITEYQQTLELEPKSAQAHFRFGQALQTQHKYEAAETEYQKALELEPGHLPAHLSLAWLLATCPEASLRDGGRAVELAQQAERLDGGESPQILDTLAAAYAEAGRFSEAVETVTRALNLTTTNNDNTLIDVLKTRLKLYEANTSYHEKP
ncbi:MAG: tetratricopeptide repeat protein [Verrucomicrobiota bacterium]|jgi:tetratricopeptide (TPR) repeat protein